MFGERYKRSNQSRSEKFTLEEKKKIATLVREKDHVWNYNNLLHRNSKAIDQGWEEIAQEMGKAKEECKRVFAHLRESLRYRQKVAKSMLERGEIENVDDYVLSPSYELREEMAFLLNSVRPRQRYITYIEGEENEAEDQDDNSQSTSSFVVKEELDPINTEAQREMRKRNHSMSQMDQSFDVSDFLLENNDYEQPSKKNKTQSKDLVYQLGKLVQAQTAFMQQFKESGTGKLNYKAELIAVDALLSQLPKNLAKKTLIEMQNYVLKKVNEHQRDHSDSD